MQCHVIILGSKSYVIKLIEKDPFYPSVIQKQYV